MNAPMHAGRRRRSLVLLAAALAGGVVFALAGCGENRTTGRANAVEPAPKPLFYRNPMNPAVTSPVPAKDAMGMDYLPVYADAGQAIVIISPAVLQNLGVRYATAEYGPLPTVVSAVGYVRYDERTIREVRIRADGWVERLTVRAEGDPVTTGDTLFEIYSPTLATAESEYLDALEFGDAALIAASERRLRALGIDVAAIRTLHERREVRPRIAVRAPSSGVVDELAVREGAMVKPDMLALRIVALDPVWVIVEVAEADAALVHAGASVAMTLPALPGAQLEGRIDYLYPQLAPATRTLRARIALRNPGIALRPDMYVSAQITGPEEAPVVHVPLEAVIRGGRADRVVLALGDGRFATRKVTVGREAGDRVAILGGLSAGDRIVSSGVFLIDSEASLRSSLGRMDAPAAEATSPEVDTGHEGH
jgi:membrane fusion protein, copper/silver efflux system